MCAESADCQVSIDGEKEDWKHAVAVALNPPTPPTLPADTAPDRSRHHIVMGDISEFIS